MLNKQTKVTGNTPIRILVKGLNWSGSGAAVGLIKEFDCIDQVPGGLERKAPAGYKKMGEFGLFRKSGLIGDNIEFIEYDLLPYLKELQRKKTNNNSFKSLYRFFRKNKLKSLEYLSDYKDLKKIDESFVKLVNRFETTKEQDERLNYAHLWIDEIVESIGGKKKKGVVFDHPIHFNKNTDYWPKVFAPYKLVVVYRDPRDQIAEVILNNKIMNYFEGRVGHFYGWGGVEAAISMRIDLILTLMKACDKTLEEIDGNNVLLISFEDLVLNYDHSTKRIREFLGLSTSEHNNKFKYFDPNWSKRNIGIHKNLKFDINKYPIEELNDWYNNRRELDK